MWLERQSQTGSAASLIDNRVTWPQGVPGHSKADVACCAVSGAVDVERDVQEGIRNGVNATPKFDVNGERIDGKVPLEGLVDAVRTATAASANLTT